MKVKKKMKEKIIENLDHPENLEKLYREDRAKFTSSLNEISEIAGSELIRFWKVRLSYENPIEKKKIITPDLLAVVLISLVTGLLVKLPAFFNGIGEEFFYTRNLAVIVFSGIIFYTFWQNRNKHAMQLTIYLIITAFLVFYLNFLPNIKSDSLNMVFIHVPLFLWCIFGLAWISFDFKNTNKVIGFIRFNGELLIMTGLMLIAFGMLTMITVGLFTAIKINIEKFYLEYIVVFEAVAAPVVAMYLIKIFPEMISKIAPVIARVFTPLVLITLVIYLASIIISGYNLSENRDLLIIFNAMLVVVMAIIIFSITGLDHQRPKNNHILVLFLLSVVAIVINTIALFVIITRIGYGLTPNRVVVLGSNILVFINLVLLAIHLYRLYGLKTQLDKTEAIVAWFMPVYFAWTIFVMIILPFVFDFK